MTQSFAVDVGGTFTDLVLLDRETGHVTFAKTATTPDAPSTGVRNAMERSGLVTADAYTFFHGTTLGLNSLLEQKGAPTGLITTRGFRDALEIGRLALPMYRLDWEKPAPMVARHLRREVTERMRADGSVMAELNAEELLREVEYLVSEGVEAIAVVFLHAYGHPQHELLAADIIEAAYPDLSVTLSHRVAREYREYERTTTAVAEASIRQRMATYIGNLETSLHEDDFRGSFVLARCDGGVMSAEAAKARPLRTLTSGPASGVMGAVTFGSWIGEPNIIVGDMGGTSFDASLIIDGSPALTASTQIGSLPLLMPVIDIATIGAGGGSIAWIDAGGALNVGPQSAGAVPGPACYAGGGDEPTFTDAALVSGLLDPSNFLGGEIEIDVERAREAIRSRIAEPLGLEIEDAAAGIVALSEANMAGILAELTIDRGLDPRDFVLMPYGGGGSLVASALASRLDIPRIVVPLSPGTFSAWGMLTLDVVHDLTRTRVTSIDDLGAETLFAPFSELDVEARDLLDSERVPTDRQRVERSIDMRYDGQEHVLTVPLLPELFEQSDPGVLAERFAQQHDRVYGFTMEAGVEVTAYRTRAIGRLDPPARPSVQAAEGDVTEASRGTRRATHRESGGTFDWTLYDRSALRAGHELEGPAIIEESSATTLVAANQRAVVDELGNIVITPVKESKP